MKSEKINYLWRVCLLTASGILANSTFAANQSFVECIDHYLNEHLAGGSPVLVINRNNARSIDWAAIKKRPNTASRTVTLKLEEGAQSTKPYRLEVTNSLTIRNETQFDRHQVIANTMESLLAEANKTGRDHFRYMAITKDRADGSIKIHFSKPMDIFKKSEASGTQELFGRPEIRNAELLNMSLLQARPDRGAINPIQLSDTSEAASWYKYQMEQWPPGTPDQPNSVWHLTIQGKQNDNTVFIFRPGDQGQAVPQVAPVKAVSGDSKKVLNSYKKVISHVRNAELGLRNFGAVRDLDEAANSLPHANLVALINSLLKKHPDPDITRNYTESLATQRITKNFQDRRPEAESLEIVNLFKSHSSEYQRLMDLFNRKKELRALMDGF